MIGLLLISEVLHKYENDVFLREFVASAKSKLQIYWGEVPMLYVIGLALDPTYKLENAKNVWKMYLQNMGWYEESYFQDKARCLETFMKNMYQMYKTRFGGLADMYESIGPSSLTTKKNRAFWRPMVEQFIPTRQVPELDELEENLSTSVASDENRDSTRNFDVLAYWKHNKSWWPNLAAMARDVLAVLNSWI